MNPHYPTVYLEELGKVYCSSGRYAEAIATLKEANKRSPSFGDVHLLLALRYLGLWLSQEGRANRTLEPALTAAQWGLALTDSHLSHAVLGGGYLYPIHPDEDLWSMSRAAAVA